MRIITDFVGNNMNRQTKNNNRIAWSQIGLSLRNSVMEFDL